MLLRRLKTVPLHSSLISPITTVEQVVMTRGQAHAPIFTAKLTVPQVLVLVMLLVPMPMPIPMPMPTGAQGHTVSATGSSKKIAKNLAAKLMLDKLEEVEGQSRLVQNSKNRVINVNTNYVKSPAALDTYPARVILINMKVKTRYCTCSHFGPLAMPFPKLFFFSL